MTMSGADYVGALLEEVALEGLDGITLPSLWVRLLTRRDFNMPVDDFLKPFVWKCACRQSEFEFYELPESRPTLQYVREEDDEGGSRISIQMEEDIYPVEVINDNGIQGSCTTYKTRKLISTEIRDDSYNMTCSLGDAGDRWGDKLVIVASQYLRSKYLIATDCDPNIKLLEVKYACLERIGRCRYLGATTLKDKSIGYRSTSAINISPKRIYYEVKYLAQFNLVRKQRFDCQMDKRIVIGRLFHLPRFFSRSRSKKQLSVDRILDYLENKPGRQEEMMIVRQDLKFDAHELNKIAKRDPVNFGVFDVLCKDLYPDKPEKHYIHGHGTNSKDRKTRILKMMKTRKLNDESSDESNDDEEDIAEVDLLYERPILRQVYHLIVESGSSGLTQAHIRTLLGVNCLEARSICRSLLRTGLVGEIRQDTGRQRTMHFISKKHSHLNTLHNTMQAELQKFTGLLQSTKTLAKTEVPEETPDNSVQEVSKVDTHSGNIVEVQPIEEEKQTTALPVDVSLAEEKLDNMFNTARILKRSRWIVELIREVRVVESTVPLLRMIRAREEEEKDTTTIDRRSLLRLLSKLTETGQIRSLTRTISSGEKETEIKLYCDADVADDDVLILSAKNQAKLKHFSASKQEVFEQTKQECFAAGLPSDISESLKTSVTKMMEFRSKLKISQMKFDPASASKYGFLPRYQGARLMHDLLWYLVYVYGESADSDYHVAPIFIPRPVDAAQDCSDNWWENLTEPPVCYDEESWKRYVHRIPRHTGYPNGWCLLSDILMVLPICVFCKLVRLPFKIYGLEELLGHPKKCLYPVTCLPWKVAEQLLFGRRYVFAMYDICALLCKMGLLSFGPQIMKDKEQVFIYLHRNASLLDTRPSQFGYKLCVPPEGIDFERVHYYFTDQSAIDQYWLDLKNFALNTNLGRRLGHLVSRENKDLSMAETKPDVSLEDALQHVTQDTVKNSGIIPGDELGAAGLDSLLFCHLERHWIVVIGNKSLAPKRKSSTDIVVPRKTAHASKRAAGQKKAQAFMTKIQFHKDKKPELVKVTIKKGRGNIGGKGIKRKAAPPLVPKVPEKKKRVIAHPCKRPKRITGRLYDDTDVDARNRMMMERVSWTIEEDTLLLLSKVANLILREHARAMIIPWNIIRDLLRDHFPQKSYDKTSASCQRRVAYVMSNPQTVMNVFVFFEEAKQDKELMSQFRGKVTVKTNEDDARRIFNELLSKLKDKFMSVRYSTKIDFKLDEFHSKYCVTPTSQRHRTLLHNDVDKTADIYVSTLHNVVHSYLSLTDKQGRQYEMFKLFNQYPEVLLQNVFIKMRENGIITRSKKTTTPHVYSVNFHQLSQRYSNMFKSRFPEDLCLDAYKFVQNVMSPSSERGFEVDVQTISHIGHAMAINALYSFETLHVEAAVPHPIIGLDCKGLLDQVGRGKRALPHTARLSAADKEREELMKELKAKIPKSDLKGDNSPSECKPHSTRPDKENVQMNEDNGNLKQSNSKIDVPMETGKSDQSSMTVEDDNNVAQDESSPDKETLNPGPTKITTSNTLIEFVSKPRQTLSITEPYQGSSTILSRLLSSIVEPSQPARVNIRDLNPQDHFVVNACTFYLSIKSQDDASILPKREETFWWDEEEDNTTLNLDVVKRVIKKQQALVPFHLDMDVVWSEMESNGVDFTDLAKNIYNHVEEGKEFGILSVELKKMFCEDPNYAKCMNHLVEQQAIFSVGSSVERHVAFPHIRPWVIHFYKNIRGRGLKATVGAQESDEVVLPAEPSSSQPTGDKQTMTGLVRKELSPLDQPAASSSGAQSGRQPEVDKSDFVSVDGTTRIRTKARSISKQPRPVSTYEKVRVQCWPWRKPEGSINRPVLQMMLEFLLYFIMANPGVSDKDLHLKYAVCLQPRTVLELLRILEDLGCIRKTIFRSSHKATLFSKPAILTKVSENSKPENGDQTVYDATMTSTILLGQFMSQL